MTPHFRAASPVHGFERLKTEPVRLHAMGEIGASSGATTSARSSAPLVSTQTDTLVAPFSGASQEQDIAAHGRDQDVAPPDTDLGVGPSYVVATVNSTINVYSRAGALAGTDDLNAFLSIGGILSSTDPRIVYDAASARWWLTDTEEQTFSCSSSPAPVLIAVSASSNPLPFSSWIVYTLPFDPHVNAFLGDQPGLGISTNVAAVTWNRLRLQRQLPWRRGRHSSKVGLGAQHWNEWRRSLFRQRPFRSAASPVVRYDDDAVRGYQSLRLRLFLYDNSIH